MRDPDYDQERILHELEVQDLRRLTEAEARDLVRAARRFHRRRRRVFLARQIAPAIVAPAIAIVAMSIWLLIVAPKLGLSRPVAIAGVSLALGVGGQLAILTRRSPSEPVRMEWPPRGDRRG